LLLDPKDVVDQELDPVEALRYTRSPSNVRALRRAATNLFHAGKVHLRYDWDNYHQLALCRPLRMRQVVAQLDSARGA